MTLPDGLSIEPFTGDRLALMALFELADDSIEAIAGYRDDGQVIAANIGKSVVGLVLLHTDRERSEIVSLAVYPDHQGQGIGARLVAAAIACARQTGSACLEVATAAADIGNLRFYQKQGFRMLRIERDAFTPDQGYPEGVLVDGIALRDRVIFDLAL